jgi:hypothetical protein
MPRGGSDAWLVSVGRSHREVEHHPALVVFGDVAMCHPDAGIRDVEQDVLNPGYSTNAIVLCGCS